MDKTSNEIHTVKMDNKSNEKKVERMLKGPKVEWTNNRMEELILSHKVERPFEHFKLKSSVAFICQRTAYVTRKELLLRAQETTFEY